MIPCVNVTIVSHHLGLLKQCVTVDIYQSVGISQDLSFFSLRTRTIRKGMWVAVKMECGLFKTSRAWEITLYNKMPVV